jgi:hypothetical protein
MDRGVSLPTGSVAFALSIFFSPRAIGLRFGELLFADLRGFLAADLFALVRGEDLITTSVHNMLIGIV